MAIEIEQQERLREPGERPDFSLTTGEIIDFNIPQPPTPPGQIQVQFLGAIVGAITGAASWLAANIPAIVGAITATKEAIDTIIEETETTEQTRQAVVQLLRSAVPDFLEVNALRPVTDTPISEGQQTTVVEAKGDTQKDLEAGYGVLTFPIRIPFNQTIKVSWELVGAGQNAGSGGVAAIGIFDRDNNTVGNIEFTVAGDIGLSKAANTDIGESNVNVNAGEYLVVLVTSDDESLARGKITSYQRAEDIPEIREGSILSSPLFLLGGAAALIGGGILLSRRRSS